jgi:hypothetical protein
MSKVFLWFFFVLSIAFVGYGLFLAERTFLGIYFWALVLIGTGYKLFFSRTPRKE